MIIDVHTHTPSHRDHVPPEERRLGASWNSDAPVETTQTWADYAAGTEGADATIVFNIAVDDPIGDTGLPGEAGDVNAATAAFVASDPTRRIGFMSVQPAHAEWREEAERARESGLVGIKLGANYQRFDPLSEAAFDLYGYAERHALPVLFHQGASPIRHAPLRLSHPLVTDEVAIAFPELRIVMAHLGHPFTREAVTVIRKHPHVYADVSALVARPWTLYEGLLFSQEWGAGGKLLFGSDYPILTPARTIEALRAVNDVVTGTGMPRVDAELIEGIIHADALGALGLALPASG